MKQNLAIGYKNFRDVERNKYCLFYDSDFWTERKEIRCLGFVLDDSFARQ